MTEFYIDVAVRPDKAVGNVNKVHKALDNTEKKAERVKSTFKGMFAGFGAAVAINQLRNLSDAFTEIQNQIRVVTNGTGELAIATADLFEIATKTRAPVRELAVLYQRASLAADNLGASQQDVKKFVEATGRAIAIQGGGMGRARGAMIQLSQAIGGAVVRAEEFNSIQEGALPIILTVAKHMKGGALSFSELRNRVIEGKVASKDFFEAFLKGGADLEAAFGKTIPTIAQSFTVLNTAMVKLIGGSDDVVAASGNISKALIVISENLGLVVKLITIAGIGALAKYAAAARVAALANGALSISSIAAAAGQSLFTAAMSAGSISALALSVALRGLGVAVAFITGPVGIALMVSSLFLFRDSIFGTTRAIDDEISALINLRKESDAGAITSSAIADKKIIEAQNRQENIRGIIGERLELLKLKETRLEDVLASAVRSKTGGLFDISRAKDDVNEVKSDIESAQSELQENAAVIRQLFGQKPKLKAREEIADFEKELAKLRGIIDPAGVALEKFLGLNDVLIKGLSDGIIPLERQSEFMDKLKKSFEDAIDPAGTFIRKLKEQADFIDSTRGLDEDSIRFLESRAEAIKKLGPEYDKLSDAQKHSLDQSLMTLAVSKEEVLDKERLAESLGNLLVITGQLSNVQLRFATDTKVLDDNIKAGNITEQEKIGIQADLLRSYFGITDALGEYSQSLSILDNLLENYIITNDQYGLALDDLQLKLRNTQNLQSDTFGESFTSRLQIMAIESKNAFASIGNDVAMIFGPGGSFQKGIGDAVAGALFMGKSFKESLRSIGKEILSSVVSSLVQIGVQMGINFIIGKAFAAASTIASTTQAALVASAWAPAATFVSLASFGANSVPAIAGMLATAGTAKGIQALSLADGGYVSGPGTSRSDSIPARLSDGEFVVNAAATRNNLALLEAINSGRSPTTTSSSNTNVFDGPAFSLTISGRGDENNDDLITTIREFVLDEQRTGGLFEGAT